MAVLQIASVLSGSVISLGIGIAALVLYNDPEVRDYFSSKLCLAISRWLTANGPQLTAKA